MFPSDLLWASCFTNYYFYIWTKIKELEKTRTSSRETEERREPASSGPPGRGRDAPGRHPLPHVGGSGPAEWNAAAEQCGEWTSRVVRGIDSRNPMSGEQENSRREKETGRCARRWLVQGPLFSVFLCEFFSILQEFFTVLWVFLC